MAICILESQQHCRPDNVIHAKVTSITSSSDFKIFNYSNCFIYLHIPWWNVRNVWWYKRYSPSLLQVIATAFHLLDVFYGSRLCSHPRSWKGLCVFSVSMTTMCVLMNNLPIFCNSDRKDSCCPISFVFGWLGNSTLTMAVLFLKIIHFQPETPGSHAAQSDENACCHISPYWKHSRKALGVGMTRFDSDYEVNDSILKWSAMHFFYVHFHAGFSKNIYVYTSRPVTITNYSGRLIAPEMIALSDNIAVF